MAERIVYVVLSLLTVLCILSVNTKEVILDEGECSNITFDLPTPIVCVESDSPDTVEVLMSFCYLDECTYTVSAKSPGLARVTATSESGETETFYVGVKRAKK